MPSKKSPKKSTKEVKVIQPKAPSVSFLKNIQKVLFERKLRIQKDITELLNQVKEPLDEEDDPCERELSIHILETQEAALQKIDEALKKIDQGSFGICLRCGQSITQARLESLPGVLLCYKCKMEEETEGLS